MEWLVLADDLTGAADTGLQFAQSGLTTSLVLSECAVQARDTEVLVVDTENRRRQDLRAVRQAIVSGWRLRAVEEQQCFLKIDSTMRGHVGIELDALMKVSKCRTAVITPAYPQNGRKVMGSALYVHGARKGDLLNHLRPFTQSQVHGYRLDDLRQGRALPMEGIIAADAETPQDLEHLVIHARSQFGRCLWAGSAGLAKALMSSQGRKPHGVNQHVNLPSFQHAFGVVGSQSAVSRRQVEDAERHGMAVFCWDPVFLLDSLDEAAAIALEALTVHGTAVATVSPSKSGDLSGTAAAALGRLTAAVLLSITDTALFLTGGDTAYEACRAFGGTRLRVLDAFSEGVPICRVEDGPERGMFIITKAGGFGGASMMRDALDCLRKGGEISG